jgi:hypothetical protein
MGEAKAQRPVGSEGSAMGEFNVFLAWSGQVSKAVAEAWHEWLPLAIQGAKPWMSSTDIPKGTAWFGELADQLKGIRIGIICVTPDNLSAPSIHFEAGALSKTVAEQQYVCPYLLNVKDTDLGFPLAQFQATKAERDDTRQLFHTLHRALQTSTVLNKEQLDTVFEKWWPDLQSWLKAIPLDSGQQRPHREQAEILEEVLELVRDLARRPHIIPAAPINYRPGVAGFETVARILGGEEESRPTEPPGPPPRPSTVRQVSLPPTVIRTPEKNGP